MKSSYTISNFSKQQILIIQKSLNNKDNGIKKSLLEVVKLPKKSKSNVFLNDFYTRLLDFYIPCAANITKLVKDCALNFKNILNNPFLGDAIIEEIKTFEYNTCIEYHYNGLNTILNICAKDENDFKSQENILKELSIRTLTLVSFYNTIENVNISTITYNIYLTNHKKFINKMTKDIAPININTGSTLARGLGDIDLWRKEELLKVSIHELIHCLKFDIQHYPNELLERFYKEFCINSNNCNLFNSPYSCNTVILPNEGYTEMMAQLINMLFHYYHKYNTNIFNYNKFKNLIIIELLWGLIQVNKILKHYKFNNISNFIKNNNNKNNNKTCSNLFSEKTNSFSYFIIRVALYSHFSTLMAFIQNNINFVKIKNENINQFTTLSINAIKSDTFKLLLELVDNIPTSESLRLSILE